MENYSFYFEFVHTWIKQFSLFGFQVIDKTIISIE
jgi:hypothetical protein